MIEVTEYDDRSSNEDLVRAIERLASQDKVDLILPPWSTGANLAVAPLFAKYGYPQLAVTAVTDKAPEFAARWDRSFWMLGGGHDYAKGLVDVLAAARDEGKINSKVAVVSVADGFGIDLITGARPAFKEAGFELVYDKTYPLGTSDFRRHHERSPGLRRRQLRRLLLSARQLRHDKDGAGHELQSGRVLHLGRRRLPDLSRHCRRQGRRRNGHRWRRRRQRGDQGLFRRPYRGDRHPARQLGQRHHLCVA